MNAAKSVSATFSAPNYTLSVSVTGNGSVTSSPTGINCPSTCSAIFNNGAQVTLTATPGSGEIFGGWSGACIGNGDLYGDDERDGKRRREFRHHTEPASDRTWVSGASGSDSNPCTRTAPCATFAAALAVTPPGGEIDVLDPGDFGPVTITQSVSIAGFEANPTGITPSTTNGIVINAGPNDVIDLHGLTFNGAGAGGVSGVVFNSGAKLQIQDCVFQDFQQAGILFAPGSGSASTTRLVVENSTANQNGIGISIAPIGGVSATASLRNLALDRNGSNGLQAETGAGAGSVAVAISDSSTNWNGYTGIETMSGGGSVTVNVKRLVAVGNSSYGILSAQYNSGTSTVAVGDLLLSQNFLAVTASGVGASVLSYSNNQLTRNVVNGTFTSAATPQ